MSKRFGSLVLKRSSSRERVLANRHQEAHAQLTPVDDLRKLERECALAPLPLVVAEELLELVEDHEDPAADPIGCFLERLAEVVGRCCRPDPLRRRPP